MTQPRVVIRANRLAALTRAVEQAIPRALNRAIDAVEVQIARELSRATGITQKPIKRRLRKERAFAGRPEARLTVASRPVGLIHFGARQTRQGVTHKGPGARSLLRHAFIAKMPNAYRGVFKRLTKKRLKIQRQDGPPLTAVASLSQILARGLAHGESVFRRRLTHELRRARGGGG